jgi:hypothetical protein
MQKKNTEMEQQESHKNMICLDAKFVLQINKQYNAYQGEPKECMPLKGYEKVNMFLKGKGEGEEIFPRILVTLSYGPTHGNCSHKN